VLAVSETAPTQYDLHLQLIAERGRIGWQKAFGYNWRALVEADISRYEQPNSAARQSNAGHNTPWRALDSCPASNRCRMTFSSTTLRVPLNAAPGAHLTTA